MTHSFIRDVQGVRWTLSERLRSVVPAGGALGEWLGTGDVTVVKDRPHRAVYRVRHPDLDVFVKHNRPVGLRGQLREWLRPLKARREYELGCLLRARGVVTPEPLAWGSGGDSGRTASWLMTETVAEATSLLTYLEQVLPGLPAGRQVRERQAVARALGAFVATLHTAAIYHHDLHPGNVLLQWADDSTPTLALIDLHALRVGGAVHWSDCERNLAVLNRYFVLRASRADRRRFWASYIAGMNRQSPAAAGQVARLVEDLTWESNRAFWRDRDRRCLATNRYYLRLHVGDARGHAVREVRADDVRALMADPFPALASPGVRLLKQSASSTVAEIKWRAGTAVLKHFRAGSRSDPWLGLLRMSPAMRSWVYGHGMRDRGLPTARPLAIFHQYRGGRPHDGFLLSEKIEGATGVDDWVRRIADPMALRNRSEALARLVRELHRRGLSHRDLKAANLLTPVGANDHRFWFIDLVGIRRCERVSRRRRVRDLARLHASFRDSPLVTQTEKLRFLGAYLNWGLRGKTGWKAWWREVAQATAAKVARNLRRSRPLA